MEQDYKLLAVAEAAAARDVTFYQLMYRRAGWGILWHDESRPLEKWGGDTGDRAWRNQLVVFAYYPTLRECLDAELARWTAPAALPTPGTEGA